MKVGYGIGIACLLVAGAASADDRAAAQVLFEQGRALVKKGAFAQACPKFAESLRLDRGIGTMLWLADCEQNNGQPASAWATFKEAAAAAALSNDPREKVARDRATALEASLPRLTINVAHPSADLEVRRDGVVAGQAEWGVAVPVDPGSHAIEARSPGHVAWTSTVQVGSNARVVVDVPVLAAAPSTPESAPPAPPQLQPEPPPVASSDGSTQRVLGIGVGAFGAIGLGIGTFLSLNAKATYDASNENGHCRPTNQCDAFGTTHRHDAMNEATAATVVLGAGLLAVAGGIVLYLTAPSASRK